MLFYFFYTRKFLHALNFCHARFFTHLIFHARFFTHIIVPHTIFLAHDHLKHMFFGYRCAGRLFEGFLRIWRPTLVGPTCHWSPPAEPPDPQKTSRKTARNPYPKNYVFWKCFWRLFVVGRGLHKTKKYKKPPSRKAILSGEGPWARERSGGAKCILVCGVCWIVLVAGAWCLLPNLTFWVPKRIPGTLRNNIRKNSFSWMV